MLPDRIAAGPLRYYVMTRTKRLRDFFIGNSGLCIECCKYYNPSHHSFYLDISICTYTRVYVYTGCLITSKTRQQMIARVKLRGEGKAKFVRTTSVFEKIESENSRGARRSYLQISVCTYTCVCLYGVSDNWQHSAANDCTRKIT